MPMETVDLVPWVLGAVVAALFLFAGVLGIGTLVVRLLKLVADKPDGLRFEPSPPELVDRPDAQRARQVAVVQARRRARWALAGEAWVDAQKTKELAECCPHPLGAHAEAVAGIHAAIAVTSAAAAEAERVVRVDDRAAGDDDLRPQAEAARAARLRAEELAAGLPDPGARRRKLLLIALAAFVLAWGVAMLAITRMTP